MRVTINLFLFVAVVFMLNACHVDRGWVKFSSNTDGFSILLPAAPVKTVVQEQTAFGKQAVHYFTWRPATLDINKLKLLQVSYTDCPRRASADSVSRNATLDSSINILKRNYTELDINTEPITVEGYPARAFILQDEKENSTTIVRTIMANNRIYAVTAMIKKDYPTNDELNIFFNSFMVLR